MDSGNSRIKEVRRPLPVVEVGKLGVVTLGEAASGGNVYDDCECWLWVSDKISELGVLFSSDVSHGDIPG